jgi:hypothetical protein
LLLSLLRLTRGPNRRLAALVLVLTYAWAFVALDITHTHAAPLSPATRARVGSPGTAASTGAHLIHWAVVPPEAPCPVCAAVHAATIALTQPPAPFHAGAAAQLRDVRASFLTPPGSPSTLHLRGPPQA